LQYGESNQLHVPKDVIAPPLEIAEFVGQDLAELAESLATATASAGRTIGTDSLVQTDPKRLLYAASFFYHEILADPRVRQTVRKILQQETVMISTTVAARGILEVDSSPPLRPVMTINDKLCGRLRVQHNLPSSERLNQIAILPCHFNSIQNRRYN
jgi:hypothetical protein